MSRHPAPALALFGSILLSLGFNGLAHAQVVRNATLRSHLPMSSHTTNSWPYIHPDGREYVAVGTRLGTSIVRLTDPSHPVEVGFIPGLSTATRDVDQYGTYIYSMGGPFFPNQGIQIISMADPDHPVLVKTVHGVVETVENITIDPVRGLLYTSKSDFDTGLRIISLADPLNPVLLSSIPDYEVHDFTYQGTRGYAASFANDLMHVLDTTDPAAPQEIVSFTTGFGTHSAWPSDDGRYLYASNENLGGGELVVFDLQNILQPVEVFRANLAGSAIEHYTRVLGNRLFISHYAAGARFLDLSNPAWPVGAGYVDTYLGDDLQLIGIYDTSPFYPSGIVTASDFDSGLWVYRPGSNYGLVRGTVQLDAGQMSGPLAGASVRALPDGSATVTGADGRFGLAPAPGSVTIEVTKFGYSPRTAMLSVASGSDQTVNFTTVKSPTGTIKGSVVRSTDQAAIAGAEVTSPGTPLLSVTSGRGAYTLMKVPEGPIRVRAVHPAFVPAEGVVTVVSKKTATVNFSLPPATFYDDMEADRGWTVGAPDDNATSGQWVRVDPVGTTTISGGVQVPVQPEDDHTPSPGTQCFVTGNGVPRGAADAADVDDGKTTLTSPVLALAGVADPRIAYWRWVFVNTLGSQSGHSPFQALLSNDDGATWTPVDSVQVPHSWERVELRVLDYFATPGNVRIRFIAEDGSGDPSVIVEDAIDDVQFYPGNLAGSVTSEVVANAPAAPNALVVQSLGRTREGFTFELRMDREVTRALARLFDVNGRLVRTLLDGKPPLGSSRLVWDGRTDQGTRAASGVYLLTVSAGSLRGDAKAVLLR
jgi:choice-of-anchor B domain-containing protein